MRRFALLTALVLSTTAIAEEKAAAPAPVTPEVAKTVQAFLGKWTVNGTMTAPALSAPAPTKMLVDCQLTALGGALNCTAKADITGLGPVEMGTLIGYDPEGKVVHFMVISSAGEFHDHMGTWKDDKTLEFQPLKFKNHGQDATEDFGFSFTGPNAMSFKSVTTNADGTKETFEGTGTR